MGIVLDDGEITGDFVDSIAEGHCDFVGAREEEGLGADEAVEGGEGQAEDTGGIKDVGEVIGLGFEFDDTAGVDPEEEDLVLEALEAAVSTSSSLRIGSRVQ